jgi:bacterioferritin-associated ferredoxin
MIKNKIKNKIHHLSSMNLFKTVVSCCGSCIFLGFKWNIEKLNEIITARDALFEFSNNSLIYIIGVFLVWVIIYLREKCYYQKR